MCPGHKKGKVRKTDESVEICRNQANRNKNENPCRWCVNAICRGFLLWKGIFLDINRYRENIITVVYEINNSRNRKGNKMGNPTIDRYLVANCLYIIDEFNILYGEWDKQKLKKEADENLMKWI